MLYLVIFPLFDFYPSIFSQPLKARGGSAPPFVLPVHVCVLRALHLPLLPSRFHLFFSMLLILFVPTSPAPPPLLTFTPLTGLETSLCSWFPADDEECKHTWMYRICTFGPCFFLISNLSCVHMVETRQESNITHKHTFYSKQ